MKTQIPTIIPTTLLPKHKRPQHYKPYIIRAIGYRRNAKGQIVEDTSYKGRRCLQLIECKYSTDSNILDTITNIHNICELLKLAILRQSKKQRIEVQIIPIVISRTGNFYKKTMAEIAQLFSFQENPPDKHTYQTLPTQAQSITMAIHVHAREWLTLISKVLKNKSHTKNTNTKALNNKLQRQLKRTKTNDIRHRLQRGRFKRRGASGGGWNRERRRIGWIWPTKVQGS